LQSVGSGTGQHLVDADDVVRVGSHPQVEAFFSGDFDEVLVGADTGCFEGFGGELFVLICGFVSASVLWIWWRCEKGLGRTGDEMNAGWEFVYAGLLPAQIKDADFRVGNTTVEAGFGVWLVLAVAVASCWTSRHCAC